MHEPHALEGWSRPLAASVYRSLIAQELLVARALDALPNRAAVDDPLIAQATALIKTFERPRTLARLLKSIRRLAPSLEVVVVDDSRTPRPTPGVRTITLPYDSGLSAGRNAGLRHVRTKYVLLLDDDLVLFRGTGLGAALALMERHPEIDIMGGALIDLPFLTARSLPEMAGSVLGEATPLHPIGSHVGGLRVCAKVPNFFVARRERLALVPWDPRLKRREHADFFARATGVLTTVFNPRLRCLHARTPFDVDYMTKRLDLAEANAILAERYPPR